MTQRSHLRITAWPGGRVEPPPVLVQPCRVEGDWLVYDSLDWRYQPVPDQLYAFEAKDIVPSDAARVAALSAQVGRLTPLHDLTQDLPLTAGQHRAALAEFADTFDVPYLPPGGDAVADGIPAVRVHVMEAAFRLRVLQRLTAHALAYRAGEPVKAAWRNASSDTAAWRLFTRFANAALRPFHVRLWVDNRDPDYDIGAPRPTAYEVAVLQLVNDLATDVDFKVCAAEGCGRSFARQRDRSAHGYSRTSGVVYCSRACANTQTQREYRRRKRAERGQP
jgi:hypothetical protein